MKISYLLSELKHANVQGFQITKKNGLLKSTWLLYKHGDFYYFFDINQRIEFIEKYRYSESELINEMRDGTFSIDVPIN